MIMLLKIRHALLEITNPPATKQSAIIINNEIIISSASVLQPHCLVGTDGDKDQAYNGIINGLQQCQLINAQDEESRAGKFIRSLNFLVTFDRQIQRPQRNVAASSRRNILTRYMLHPLYVFCASEVSRNLHKILLSADLGDHNWVLRSSFVVLSMRPSSEREYFERFLVLIGNYLRHLQPIHTLDDVLVMCSPFGLENFYKTISIGKRQQENVNLTLAANFGYLLGNFMEQLGIPTTTFNLAREPSSFAWERTVVVIDSSGQQGTGTFIKVHNKHFILTCAHVVGQPNAKVHCRTADREFQSDVIWCNPDSTRPYDLALLTAPDDVPERHCVRLAKTPATLGQTVYLFIY
ncbi:uncharacterized protein LOC117192581 isoform X1 [Drosophila miranda]|uniref:uncharacterized protein LOC117192581 isoform X1 n=1 Tax=Drosophila miranda TaxID=7229 RepID=UPI00143F8D5D|nr:uncharacterized protein LOC117192581 isoform X1 [Drosophila miranda]